MPIRVKAYAPEGDAVQVHIEKRPHAMGHSVRFNDNSPMWFVDIAMRNLKDGTLDRHNGLFVTDINAAVPVGSRPCPVFLAYSGDWLVRSVDGTIHCFTPQQFDLFFERVEQPQ